MFNEFIFRPIFNLLLFIYNYVGDFGVAIIVFSIIIKIILYPLLKSQIVQSKKLQDIQPELKKIKKQAKGNKQLEYIMTMNLYKQNEIKMSKTFLTALIQLPIFIAMFQVIRNLVKNISIIDQQAYSFVKNLDRISNIISNNESFKPLLFNYIDLSEIPFEFKGTINGVLIILILIAMAYVQKIAIDSYSTAPKSNKKLRDVLNEANEGKEPDQAEVNSIMMSKMNNFMPIMLLVSFGFVFAALPFYSLISGSITILQRKFIISRMGETDVKTINQKEVDERLKKAKEAQIIFENRKKQYQNKKKKAKKPVKKRSNKK